jgi:hypothetical protein
MDIPDINENYEQLLNAEAEETDFHEFESRTPAMKWGGLDKRLPNVI